MISGQNEALHLLRDDTYEKVSIVYAARTELEQDAISVEVFTNALADTEVVQRLLEKQPRTLARAYDIAHSYETTRRAARTVTQFMQPGQRSFVNQRARATTVRENNSMPACVEPVGVAVWSIDSPERAPRFNPQWHQKKDTCKNAYGGCSVPQLLRSRAYAEKLPFSPSTQTASSDSQ